MVDNVAGGAMGKKTAEETVELYEMLGANSQHKSVKGRRFGVNEVQVNNEITTQLTVVTRQVSLLNSQAQPNNEVGGLYGHSIMELICVHIIYMSRSRSIS